MRKLGLTPILASALVACSGPSEDFSRCYQAGEFANTGCAEITGLVTDLQGVLEIRPIGELPVVTEVATIAVPISE